MKDSLEQQKKSAGDDRLLPGIGFRGYRDEDYEAVCGFLIELNQKDRTHINWNWARFEWMMEHPEFDRGARS
ncbi:MAG: hypothetical protein IJL43_04000, partial [Lachnospiraceae bacterium]|nr:hypothetical protein [Lachnospiraceae bacterium]